LLRDAQVAGQLLVGGQQEHVDRRIRTMISSRTVQGSPAYPVKSSGIRGGQCKNLRPGCQRVAPYRAPFFAVFVCHFLHSAGGVPSPWESAIASAGAFGVDLFFILSSFLITSLLLREQAREGRARIGAFWVRRALRIWPLYFTVVAVAVVITRPPTWYTIGLLTFSTNWALVHRMYESSLNVLWSLALEEQFYLAWPLCLALLRGRGLPAVALGLIGTSVFSRARLLDELGSLTDVALWIHPLGRLEPLALGILLAWGWSRWRSSRALRPKWTGVAAVAIGWAAVTGLIRFGTDAGTVLFWPSMWVYPAVDLILASMLGVVLVAGGGLLAHPVLVISGGSRMACTSSTKWLSGKCSSNLAACHGRSDLD
jgi:peptidoglycan/LPS O-acetylase OafA/YrhL